MKANSKANKYEARRLEVIDAAAALFGQLGYHGATTKLIADRVGIRQSGLYYYFSSKEEALQEVCSWGIEHIVASATAILNSNAPVDLKIRKLAGDHLNRMFDRIDYFRTFINERQFLPDDSRKSIGRRVRRYERSIVDIIRSGVETGCFDPKLNCELAALGLLAELNGVFHWYGKRAKGIEIEAIADDIATRFLTGALRR